MNRKWDKHRVLSAIKSLNDLSYSHVKRTDESLLRAGRRYYGTWQAAVEAAGLTYVRKKAGAKKAGST